MKLSVAPKDGEYSLQLNNKIFNDRVIAQLLDIKISEYTKILESCNGFTTCYPFYYFKNMEDAEKAVKKLEHYVVMATLMEK